MNNTPQAVELRPARAADLDLIAGLRRELYRRDQASIDEPRDRETLRQLIERPELGQVLLIAYTGRIAGYVLVTYCFSIEFAGRFALVDELLVSAEFRGQGIGTIVLKQLERKMLDAGISAMRLEVERSNLGAERLYERHGFERHDRHLMTKWLKRP